MKKLAYPIIVHCHLKWDGVWQRPQQFLSRLSQKHKILFVEGPVLHKSDEPPSYTLSKVPNYPNITVMKTFFPERRFFKEGDWVDSERLRMLKDAATGPLAGQFEYPVQWFYDPMAVVAFANQLNELAIVYDCMDELSQFRFAPPELRARERKLLSLADVVFAGGRKLHESKSRYNNNAHFYGCGVDIQHFGKARRISTQIPEDVKSLDGPVLGFFGVVDERMDYDLVAKIADAHPEWNLVVIGPVVKVDPSICPKRPNIHWLGPRDYSLLPAYVKKFNVCLMPFALNEATEFINPTKALEYMATARPIVSSAVPDVVALFSNIISISNSHDDFIRRCELAVESPDQAAIDRGLKRAEQNTWDSIVAKLEGHIEDVLDIKRKARIPAKQRLEKVLPKSLIPGIGRRIPSPGSIPA